MSKEYKLTTLIDLIRLDDDQIDRVCAELPGVLKQAKALDQLIGTAADILGAGPASTKILDPLTWIDDGKTDLKMNIICEGEEVFRYEKTSNT